MHVSYTRMTLVAQVMSGRKIGRELKVIYKQHNAWCLVGDIPPILNRGIISLQKHCILKNISYSLCWL